MKYILILITTLLFSCSKEENECKICTVISESNFKEADYKCDGLANNYPQYDVILSQSVGSICGENIQIQKNLVEKSVTKTLCSGVTYTERTRLDCK